MTNLEKEWFIQAPWGRICIIAWGDCYDPPVLCCHGSMDSAATFRPLIKLLPKKYYYIGIELPGSGRSDPYPQGMMIGLYDFVYSLQVVVKHFRWDSFVFLGHSMGCVVGKLYHLAYPGKMAKMIDIDPLTIRVVVPREKFAEWFKSCYTNFFDNYHLYNSSKENAPVYFRNEAIAKLVNLRGLSEEVAEATMVRWSETVGDDDHIRFTYDQRNKIIMAPPLSADRVKAMYTSISVPILTVVAKQSIDMGLYAPTPFLFDESSYPDGNYRVRTVPGNHDVHAINPERVEPYVTQFLLRGLEGIDSKSKL